MDLRYVEIKRKSVDAIRGRVFQRDGWRCRYCGSAALPLHADHVYPVIAGGETTEDNMVTSCQRCNAKKHVKIGVWPKPIGYFDERARLAKNVRFPYLAMVFVLLASFLAYNGMTTLQDFPEFRTIGVAQIYGSAVVGLVGVGCLFGGR